MAQSGTEPVAVSFYVREVGSILLGAFAVILLLAMVSYVPTEYLPSLVDRKFVNVIGSVGAALAFGGFWAFGFVAMLVPLAMLTACAFVLRSKSYEVEWFTVGFRVGGGLLFLIASTVFATLHLPVWEGLPAGAGGHMGGLLTVFTVPYLSAVGLTIVSLVAAGIALQLIFAFSWLNVLERTGQGVVLVWQGATYVTRWLRDLFVGVIRYIKTMINRRREHQSKVVLPVAAEVKRIPPTFTPARRDSDAVDPLSMIVPKHTTASASETPVLEDKHASKAHQPTPARPDVEPVILTKLPSLEILSSPSGASIVNEAEHQALIALGERLRVILADYGVSIEVESIISGPVVSRFELQLAPGLKVNKIISLANDLAREIAVSSVRVVPVIPGKSVVGIEIPNQTRATVTLKEVLAQSEFNDARRPLTLALGKDIAGKPVYADLERMPHLLVAGTTGSGKSVGINTMLLSMMYRLTPDDVRLILVDPKMLELSVYEGIPHLLTPVVTDMQDAAKALQWCVAEMERRYRLMKELKVRNLGGFNEKIAEADQRGESIPDPVADVDLDGNTPALEKLPLIVVVIDEFADMIMIVGKKVEQLIARIAQKARAAGIHLILATQRPSVDVITGLIKANIPSRISYQVSSQVDSRTIIDQVGAEQLLGHGDMLYLAPGTSVPERVHGAFVSDDEVLAVIADWRQRGAPQYVYDIMNDEITFDASDLGFDGGDDVDDIYQQAVQFVIESRRASASALQTKFQIGWNKAARYMDQMEKHGIVTVPDHKGRREVLAAED